MDVFSIIPTRFPEWGFSPWMRSILGHSLLRAYHTLSGVRAREILINLADCVSRRGVYFGPVGASVSVAAYFDFGTQAVCGAKLHSHPASGQSAAFVHVRLQKPYFLPSFVNVRHLPVEH